MISKRSIWMPTSCGDLHTFETEVLVCILVVSMPQIQAAFFAVQLDSPRILIYSFYCIHFSKAFHIRLNYPILSLRGESQSHPPQL